VARSPSAPEAESVRRHGVLVCLVIGFLLLSGCGFKLTGYGVASTLDKVSLTAADAFGPMEAMLVQVLRESGVAIVAPGAALFHIELSGERNTRRALSAGGRLGVAEYELNLEVALRVLDNEGVEAIPATLLRLARTFSFDPGSLQATNEEEERVRTEMRRELSSRILRRVEARYRGGQ
jgi:outer membrane lipopolysaccharide assembly protein LptE/RlpB